MAFDIQVLGLRFDGNRKVVALIDSWSKVQAKTPFDQGSLINFQLRIDRVSIMWTS